MTAEEEHKIISKVLSGSTESYAMLVNEYKDMAFTVAVRILRNKQDAEEIAMDAFVKAYENLKNFNMSSRFSSWLYRITYNAAIDFVRKTKPDFMSMDAIDQDSNFLDKILYENTAETLNDLEEKDRTKYIRMAINALPEDEAVIITLYYLSGNTVMEISEITGLSSSNVKVKLYRSRNKLYKELKRLLKNEVGNLL